MWRSARPCSSWWASPTWRPPVRPRPSVPSWSREARWESRPHDSHVTSAAQPRSWDILVGAVAGVKAPAPGCTLDETKEILNNTGTVFSFFVPTWLKANYKQILKNKWIFLVGRLGCCSTKKLGIWLKLESLLFKRAGAGAGEKNFGAFKNGTAPQHCSSR